MLSAGLEPSVFFRFPGLVSRPDVFEKVVALGLVPLGSDAWLAKSRQPPAEGSIVLVHANGNEPLGSGASWSCCAPSASGSGPAAGSSSTCARASSRRRPRPRPPAESRLGS